MAQGQSARVIGLGKTDPLMTRLRGEAEEAARREPELAGFLIAMILNQESFEAAVAASKSLHELPDNQTLLQLYALYKQGTAGDAEGKRPGFGDMVGRAKFDAWAAIKGTGKDAAMQRYIDLIESLKG